MSEDELFNRWWSVNGTNLDQDECALYKQAFIGGIHAYRLSLIDPAKQPKEQEEQ